MGYKGRFQRLRDKTTHDRYNNAILSIFTAFEYSVITVLIDKSWMLRQLYWSLKHPYHYLMSILIEKYCQLLERRKAIGDVMPESRQSKDQLLQAAYDEVRKVGTRDVLPIPMKLIGYPRSKKIASGTKEWNVY